MKLVIFGVTGGTGRAATEQALAAGHEVTAVARRPEAVQMTHPRLRVVRGDVLVANDITGAVAGQEAVISAIGVTSQRRAPTVLYSQGITNILNAMEAAGVRRLMCVSASGLDPGPLWQRLIAKPILWTVFKEGYSDMARMETIVRRSSIDWTIVRPPRLTDGAHRGRYQFAVNRHLSSGATLSRADLADYLVAHLCDTAIYRAWVDIAY